jgi:hypothetical protein
MTTVTDVDNQGQTDTNSGGGRLSGVKDKAGAVRTKAADTYATARERTSSALGTARQGASRARQTTSQKIETTPELALIGGLALGAIAAALLPKSRKEEELLGTYGKQINDRAREAARAAKEAGRDKLDELGLNKEAAKQKLSEVAKQAGEAVKTTATAAAQAAKTGQGGTTGQPQGTSDPLASGQTQPSGLSQL